MVDRITTNPNDVINIPEEDLPLMVLSDNVYSFFAWGIRAHQHGIYNHFMWLVEPGILYSQDWVYHKVPIENYLQGRHRLKFITGKTWSRPMRQVIKIELLKDLRQPWYKRLYDPLQIIGIFIGWGWLQIPGSARICSDFGRVLTKIDKGYDLKYPSPSDINRWTKARPNRYEVYLRFIPD
jgi:hypothetical protein